MDASGNPLRMTTAGRMRRALKWGLAGMLAALVPAKSDGRVVWADLLTSGVPTEEAVFYTKIFGWTMQVQGAAESPYVVLLDHGQKVAGVACRTAEQGGPARNAWLGFFGAARPAELAARAEAAGAVTLMIPTSWPGRGEHAVLADAEGATFGVMATREPLGGRGWSWGALLAAEPKARGDFYAGLLGAEVTGDSRTPLFAGDFLLSTEGTAFAAVTALTGEAGHRAGWLWCVQVSDLDDVVRAVERQGGQILRRPGIDLMGGRVAVAADPRGAVFGLFEKTPVQKQNAATISKLSP